jgi:hypothetical protein
MSYQVTNTFTRPTAGVNFHLVNMPDTYIQYVITNYKSTNKIVDLTSDISTDGLTLTAVWTWANKAEFDAWSADPVVIENQQNRDAWNEANGITMQQTAVEI